MSYQTVTPLLIGVFIFTLNSCAPTQQISEQLLNLKLQMEELQKDQKDVEWKVEGLNNRVFLVREKVDINAKSIEELKTVALLATPPDKLKVIKVAPAKKGDRTITSIERTAQKGLSRTGSKQRIEEDLTKRSAKESNPEDVYRDAYLLFEKGIPDDALEAFSDFLKRFPGHPLSDNAQYWIGEIYYSQREFFMALREFRKVVDNHPEENKVPDAILKMAFSYSELGDIEAYIENLEMLIDIYPASEAAQKAIERLEEIQLTGN